jgi:hypothetical protein
MNSIGRCSRSTLADDVSKNLTRLVTKFPGAAIERDISISTDARVVRLRQALVYWSSERMKDISQLNLPIPETPSPPATKKL